MNIKDILQVVGFAAMPIIETRGAVPIAILKGFSAPFAVFFSALGSLIPVVPLYYVFSPVGSWVRDMPGLRRVIGLLEKKARSGGDSIRKWESLGLFLFVAIPLPMTGVWTGTAAAALLGINLRYALFSVSLGSIMSGVIVVLITNGILRLW